MQPQFPSPTPTRNQQRLAPEPIRQRAAGEAADSGERERGTEQHRDVVGRQREILRQRRRRDDKAQKEEIVEIENPPDERERENPAMDRLNVLVLAQQVRGRAHDLFDDPIAAHGTTGRWLTPGFEKSQTPAAKIVFSRATSSAVNVNA